MPTALFSSVPEKRTLLYLAGPGDVVGSFRDWIAGVESVSETTRTYSGEAFRYCKARNMNAIFVSAHSRPDQARADGFEVENRPKSKFIRASGMLYHVREFVYGISLLVTSIRRRADIVIMDSGTTQWFMLCLFRLAGARTYATFHNAYYPMHRPRTAFRDRLLEQLDRFAFKYAVSGCLAASEECRRQYQALAGPSARAVTFNGMFHPASFAQLERKQRPDGSATVPVILFVGRIEASKGVFDLLRACELVAAETSPTTFRLDFCGDGSAFAELERQVADSPIAERIRLHGRLTRDRLLPLYERSHFVVVPTCSGFAEGFAMVCAEAIACGKPVITTDVVPAAEMLAAAVLVVPADNAIALAEAMRRMLSDTALYERLRLACGPLAHQFFDSSRGLAAAMATLIDGS